MAVDVRVDPARKERYEEFFGTPRSGRLILEINGADAAQYTRKPVSVNGQVIGDLPAAGDWTEKSLELTPAALDGLMESNGVSIANSAPPDAFKVRRARIEIVNTDGKGFATGTDTGAYTSVAWDFQEGKVGSPIELELRFRRP